MARYGGWDFLEDVGGMGVWDEGGCEAGDSFFFLSIFVIRLLVLAVKVGGQVRVIQTRREFRDGTVRCRACGEDG